MRSFGITKEYFIGMTLVSESREGKTIKKRITCFNTTNRKVFIETYGCQMNFSDSEIVASVLQKDGFEITNQYEEANLIFLNTCSIRENAEQKVRNRLKTYNSLKEKKPETIIGVLGCMAERLKAQLLEEERLVDIVAGPDSYRELPFLISEVLDGRKAVNVILSKEETYADINPVRLSSNGVTAFISIMRGCDNMCTFCVVPFTRGRERSRNPESIISEAKDLYNKGYREVTLLGQNVDSYLWYGSSGLKKDFSNLSKKEQNESVNFAELLGKVADIHTELRIRFSTSHPKDMTNEVLYTMAKHKNICNYIHLPIQSGSSAILEKMNRGYSRKWYIERIKEIRRIIPECGISTDIITGFCSETDADHLETVSLMDWVQYNFAYMFKYSERPKTLAERKYKDDVDEEMKSKRLSEIIALQQKQSLFNHKKTIGKTYEVLVEGFSKRSKNELFGRNTQNSVVIFPKEDLKPGDYVRVKITDCTSATLIGQLA